MEFNEVGFDGAQKIIQVSVKMPIDTAAIGSGDMYVCLLKVPTYYGELTQTPWERVEVESIGK